MKEKATSKAHVDWIDRNWFIRGNSNLDENKSQEQKGMKEMGPGRERIPSDAWKERRIWEINKLLTNNNVFFQTIYLVM